MVVLDEEQKEVVGQGRDRNILVTALAGTGKTRTLTERIVHLIREEGADPERILAITFTVFATQEMENRIGTRLREVTGEATVPDIMTWDGFFLRVLEAEKRDVEECPNHFLPYPLMGEGDPIRAIDPKKIKHHRLVRKRIQELVLKFLADGEFAEHRRYWQEKYDYILVDECQDMGINEWRLVELLRGEGNRFFFVGDPHQHVFSHKKVGESLTAFDAIKGGFPGLRDLRISTNYRSDRRIVELAARWRSDNAETKVKSEEEGEVMRFRTTAELLDSGRIDLLDRSRSLAILVRRYDQAIVFVEELIRRKINFRMGSFFLFKDMNVKVLIDFLWAVFFDEANIKEELKAKVGGAERLVEEFRENAKERGLLATVEEAVESLGMGALHPVHLFMAWLRNLTEFYPEKDAEFFLLNLKNLAVFEKKGEQDGDNYVIISTIEKTKGLEWDDVVIVGWDRLSGSGKRIVQNQTYVAITRARRRLFLVREA